MKKIIRSAYTMLATMGIEPLKTIAFARGLPRYFRDLHKLKSQERSGERRFPLGSPYPCLDNRFSNSGAASGHYFHQDLLVARRIFSNHPIIHVDVGSRVDGFIAHVAAFRSLEVIDIRPQTVQIPNVTFIQADFMAEIDDHLVEYCDSLSCLHAMEHFGLGRYGDEVNYDGYLLGLDNAHRILKTGGKFYFSVPIGPQRIEFNAHRVFSVRYLLELLESRYCIDRFSFVDDCGDLYENAALSEDDIQSNFGCVYCCGIFEMTKQ
jgi:SAM-dependent methyltransferase